MATAGALPHARGDWDCAKNRCFELFHCLSDPVRRSSFGLKAALLLLHVVLVGTLFLLDRNLILKTRKEPWYTSVYLVLFAATLFQYFFTSGSSPGYVLDAVNAWNESHTNFSTPSSNSLDVHQLGRILSGTNDPLWVKYVMDLYPQGSSRRQWTCSYCNIIQPPRAKHCHDCEKCVLQFDHHCVWLGTCIGQRNHCRFWWYLFEECVLCMWTIILYISYLKASITRQWWMDAVAIFFLLILLVSLVFIFLLLLFHSYLVLTNQTTYELVRRRRIPYLRGISERVYPFSKGILKNLFEFCCFHDDIYSLERVPTPDELEAKAKPCTCTDIAYCRCC